MRIHLKDLCLNSHLCNKLLRKDFLRILLNDTHMEKLCFIQFSTRMAGWLLLTFLICLHNQLSSIIHCITRIKSTDVWKMCSSNRQYEWIMVAAYSKIYGKIWVGFCRNTGKRLFLEVSFSSQQKEHRFF